VSVERVFVAGAGLMGHGIAQVHAAVGKEVTVYEPDLARAEAGIARIAGNLERAVAKGKLTSDEREAILARLTGTSDLEHAADAFAADFDLARRRPRADAVLNCQPGRGAAGYELDRGQPGNRKTGETLRQLHVPHLRAGTEQEICPRSRSVRLAWPS